MRYTFGSCFGMFAANGQLEPLSRAKASMDLGQWPSAWAGRLEVVITIWEG